MEAVVAERAAVMRQPGGARYVRQTAGGFWIEFNTRPLPDGGLLGFYRDITPLKRREAELEAERTLLREVIDGVDALVLLLDRDANILVANASHRQMMATPDEFYRPGTNLADAVRWRYRQGIYGFDTDEEEAVRSRIANVYSGGVIRYERLMPDGVWVETIWTPISDGRVVGLYRDITPLKRREAELEAERTLLREVLASNEAVVTVFDAEATVMLANGRHEELLGTPPGLFAPGARHADGLRFLYRRGEYGPPGDAAAEEAFLRQRLAEIYAGRVTRDVRHMPNGRWVERTFAPLSGGGVIGHARDVTLLKQREAELEAERSLLREVIDSSDALIALFDSGGTVLLANDRHKDLMGLPEELFEPGGSFLGAMRWLGQHGFYGGESDVDALILERLTRIYSGEITRFSRQMRDGRWLEFTYRVISGGRLIGQARDITLLKQRESELETERTLLREVLDSSDSVIIVLDAQAHVLLANGRFEDLLGIPAELHLPGSAFAEIMRFLYRRGDFGFEAGEEETIRERLAAVFAGELERYLRELPNGRWVEFNFKRISGGRVISFARDLSALKNRETELDAERRLLREVLDSTEALVTLFDDRQRIILANRRHSELLDAPQELFAPGAHFAEGIAWLARRGDFGGFEDEASFVADRMAGIYRDALGAGAHRYGARAAERPLGRVPLHDALGRAAHQPGA